MGTTCRIISDGTPVGTTVLDASGKPIPYVTKLSWEMDNHGRGVITMSVYGAIEASGDAVTKIVHTLNGGE